MKAFCFFQNLNLKSMLLKGRKIAETTVCGLVTLFLLMTILKSSGDTRPPQPQAPAALSLMDQFDMAVGNAVSDALQGIQSVKKIYFLPDDSSPGPYPDKKQAGTTENPGELKNVLKKAREKLRIGSMLFSEETEILPGSRVRYYLDDTIFSVSWKLAMDGCVYSFAEVKIVHPSQFRRFLSGGEYGSGVLYRTSQMADSVHAVTASSADYYAYRNRGITVYNGNACRVTGNSMDVCFVDDRGDLQFQRAGSQEISSREAVEAYVKKKHIRFSLSFGPVLLEGGRQVPQYAYPVGENFQEFSRAALCQQGPLHYIIVMANMEDAHNRVPTIPRFAENLQKLGIRKAYALDGGQTATLISNGDIVNAVNYGSERDISDIIYFATAIPGENRNEEKTR